jgi:hypothetical protein
MSYPADTWLRVMPLKVNVVRENVAKANSKSLSAFIYL